MNYQFDLTTFLDEARLPAPDPVIPPGIAITGMRMYLVIGGQSSWTHTVADAVTTTTGSVSVSTTVRCDATGYDVDWGDGSGPTRTASSGGPYPNGDVTHIWQNRGTYRVTVEQHWGCRANSSVGSPSAGATSRTTVIDDYPVQEIQAVIRR